ncbi:MAG: 50S ribosomal protein L24 [Leptospiraceae bacterium]|nr:50S ribosomal protein L24 [Leptospiraceae bacterium]MCB1202046.1 50S ribosomal protein L24 [Leptospiraceae bacterium]
MAIQKEPIKTKIKKGDEVIVIAGKFRKQKGEVLRVDRESQKIFVKGVNLRKRFARPTQEAPKGGIIEIEGPIHLSNVMMFDSKAKKPSRVKFGQDKNGAKVRILAASGKELE